MGQVVGLVEELDWESGKKNRDISDPTALGLSRLEM